MQHQITARRVLIVDDHELVRESVRNTINAIGGEVIGEATNGLMGADQALLHRPDLIIMDIHMPEMDGIESTRLIKGQCSEIPIIILSAHADKEYVFKAIQAGAAGYLLKDAPIDTIEDTIRRTLEGEETMSAKEWRDLIWRVADHQAQERRNAHHQEPATVTELPTATTVGSNLAITTRELEVLQCITRGWTNQEIAAQLYISPHTVKGHVEHLLEKMRVSDRTQAAVRGVAWGLAWDEDPIAS